MYTMAMWRAVVVLLVVLVGWTTTDALVCPDGCADTVPGLALSATHSGVGCCVLCHGCFAFNSYIPELLRGPSIREPVIFVTTESVSSTLTRIEHPPRA